MQATLKAIPDGKPNESRSRNGNKLLPEDRPAHEWYRFVLSFPPHLVREYLNRFGVHQRQVVLDPFCGTGTTLVECKKLGIKSVGIEANPMACFASKVKLDWQVGAGSLLDHAQLIAEETLARLQSEGIEDEPAPPLFRAPHRGSPKLLCLPKESAQLLGGLIAEGNGYEGLPF